MIQEDTFREMLEKIDDKDFILKTIQADVILTKATLQESDYDKEGNFVKRLSEENCHNDITPEHYNYAVSLFTYQNCKSLSMISGNTEFSLPEKKC